MRAPLTRVSEAVEAIAARIPASRSEGSLLVAMSGIDGSGKSTLARELSDQLMKRGHVVALIPIDPWHHPAAVRFGERSPGRHFYRNAFRFEELFERLVDPLRRHRSVSLAMELLNPATDQRISHAFDFRDVDVILLEGIFLLKAELRERYDLMLWVECPFEIALERALARNQEELPPERLLEDYRRIYFAAQRVHLRRDRPKDAASAILWNG